jgi:tRNA threonylcarbamoyladenosine biosynthesis protein TsaE
MTILSTYSSHSEKETKEIAKEFVKTVLPTKVLCLSGSLGSGKTIFAKGIAEALGIEEAIVSPTFTLIQEYNAKVDFYHLDLYRLADQDEFETLGGEELLYREGITLIEWGEKIGELLPPDAIYVTISIENDGTRTIVIKGKNL